MTTKSVDKYWAIYKPDADTKDGILLFRSKLWNGKHYLVMVKDKDCGYPLSVVRKDKNWVIWRQK